MSVNMRFGINPDKTKRFGPLFHTIDFESNKNYPSEAYKDRASKLKAGNVIIDGKEYPMTFSDIGREMRKIDEAVNTFYSRTNPATEYVWRIGGREWTLTKKETEYLYETLSLGKSLIQKKFRLNI